MHLGRDDVQAAERLNALAEPDVRAASGHVGRHHDPADLPGLRDLLRRVATRQIDVVEVETPRTYDERDSIVAAQAMREEGVGAVVVLGGDGTNRAVALGWPDVPVVPLWGAEDLGLAPLAVPADAPLIVPAEAQDWSAFPALGMAVMAASPYLPRRRKARRGRWSGPCR